MDWKKANKYLPKELKDDFKMHMQKYIMKGISEFETKHEISIIEHLEEMENFSDSTNLKENLQRKLFTEAEKDLKYEEPQYKDINEAIEYCKQTFRFIDCEKNKSKKYYFHLGEALFKIKKSYDSKKVFMKDMEKKLERKIALIYKYISFYQMCIEYKNIDLVNCSLSFKNIVNNRKLINEIYNRL